MVLIRVLGLCALVAGCGQSLFDSRGGTDGGGGGGDGNVPSTCPAPCLADAASDFDGTPTGTTMRWRYLEDHRDRTWTAMTASATEMTGAVTGNRITTCAAHPDAAACSSLPNALLVSSAGATSAADPAIEFTAATKDVVQLSLRARVPTGAPPQVIRIYRNSREDVLYTATASAGTTLEQAITLDALAGDRFLVAVAPTAMGATDVALQLFASSTGSVFPATCQLALPFAAGMVTGNTIGNQCGATFTHYNAAGAAAPPVLGAGPFAEAGMAANIATDTYYDSMPVLERAGDSTIQLWMQTRVVDPTYGEFAFSDIDLDATGGLSIDVFFDAAANAPKLEVVTCTGAGNPLMFANTIAAWPDDHAWRFVRVVHTGGNVNVCVDGKRVGSFPLPAGKLQSTYPPFLGKNVKWTPSGAFFDGSIDDVRVFKGALPCEP